MEHPTQVLVWAWQPLTCFPGLLHASLYQLEVGFTYATSPGTDSSLSSV